MAEKYVTFAETMPDVFGQVVFCDDLRFENTGKLFAIGMYSGAMFIHGGFPAGLKSFAILVSYAERIGTQNEPVTIEVLFPGMDKPFAQMPVQLDQLRNKEGLSLLGQPGSFYTASFPLILGPLAIQERGMIIVVARVGDKVYRLGGLVVVEAPVPPTLQSPTKEAAN